MIETLTPQQVLPPEGETGLAPRDFHYPITNELGKRPAGVKVPDWNRMNKKILLDIQKTRNEGCFFAGLFSLSTAKYPDRDLPDANGFWEKVRMHYGSILLKERVLVRHDCISEALNIYEEWGLPVRKIYVNLVGEAVIGKYLTDPRFGKSVIMNRQPVETENLDYPYSILVHQAGGDTTHFITDDGTEEAREMREAYKNDGYRIIAVFEFGIGPVLSENRIHASEG